MPLRKKRKSLRCYITIDLLFKMMLYPFFYSFNKMLIYYVYYTDCFLSLDLNSYLKEIKERLNLIEQKDGLNLFFNSFLVYRTS